MTLLRVKDTWHKFINGENEPYVYSDHPSFEGDTEKFLQWVAQHTNDLSVIEKLS